MRIRNERARWTCPEDVNARLERLWARGELLRALVDDTHHEALFPLRIPLRGPDGRELLDRFDEVRAWVRALEEASQETRRSGFQLVWEEVRHRHLGANRLPRQAVFEKAADALRAIGRTGEGRRFAELYRSTVEAFPALAAWLSRRALVVLEHGDDWAKVLSVLRWFGAHPQPGCYLRQVDPPGVDTKFIERHRGLLAELLELTRAPGSPPSAGEGASFEQRFGLKEKPVLLRIRVLDPRLAPGGVLNDLTAPVTQMAALPLRPRRVFVTENDTNALAFSDAEEAVVVFGRGYALDLLAAVPWIRDAELHYWGDLDTHGFAILDRLRASIPHATSLLMDEETLLAHRDRWTQEPADARCLRELPRLSPEEAHVFDALRTDRHGPALRLEQERVSWSHVERALARLPR